ncbi:MAG: hypothetical protein O7D32_07860, partial [bacterium]|nr:hypothetical protein [bacterium]
MKSGFGRDASARRRTPGAGVEGSTSKKIGFEVTTGPVGFVPSTFTGPLVAAIGTVTVRAVSLLENGMV